MQPAQHGVALRAVHVDEQRDVGLEVIAQEVGGHARREGIDAAAEEEALEGGDHLLRRAEPAEAEAGAEDLGHVPARMTPPAGVERVQRRASVIALEAQLAVGVVLEDRSVSNSWASSTSSWRRRSGQRGPGGFWKLSMV